MAGDSQLLVIDTDTGCMTLTRYPVEAAPPTAGSASTVTNSAAPVLTPAHMQIAIPAEQVCIAYGRGSGNDAVVLLKDVQ